MHGRKRHFLRLGRRGGRSWLPLAALALLAAVLTGCSTRNDPHYNRYCPYDGRPGVLDYAEDGLDSADQGLDNVQERLENMIE